jgi:hypothetical protein
MVTPTSPQLVQQACQTAHYYSTSQPKAVGWFSGETAWIFIKDNITKNRLHRAYSLMRRINIAPAEKTPHTNKISTFLIRAIIPVLLVRNHR